MGQSRDVYRFLVGKPEGKIPLGRLYLSLDGRIILRWIFKWDGGLWTGSIWQLAGTCEFRNEPSTFTKCGEFLN
jgi:hypothetical protein